MPLKFTFNPFTATFDSVQNLSGLNNRVTTLENNEYKIVYYTAISAASGTITVPQGATIMLDQFPNGVDAYVSQVDVNWQPTGILPKTGLGVDVVITSFDALGNYTLSGTPSSFPVAIIYVLKIKAIDYNNLVVDNILEDERIDDEDKLLTWSASRSFTAGQKFIWQSPHGDWRTYIVRSGQTLNAGETPFTHPVKVKRIDGDKIINAQYNIRAGSSSAVIQKVVTRPIDGKICYTNINGGVLDVLIANYDPTEIFINATINVVNIGTNIQDIAYIESLDEFWIAHNSRFLTRINASTNTVIGSVGATTLIPSGTILGIYDASSVLYVHYLDTTNKIESVNKNTFITSTIINSGLSNDAVNAVYNPITNVLYVTSTLARVSIYDLTANTFTNYTDNVRFLGGTLSLEIVDNKLYVGVQNRNISIHDITLPNNPTYLSTELGLFRARALKYNPKTNCIYVYQSSTGSGDGSWVSVINLVDNKVIDSHIINNTGVFTAFKYDIMLHQFGDFVVFPWLANATTQGNKIFFY